VPYKHNEDRRHKFEKPQYKVTNWPAYVGAAEGHVDLVVDKVNGSVVKVHFYLDAWVGLEMRVIRGAINNGMICAATNPVNTVITCFQNGDASPVMALQGASRCPIRMLHRRMTRLPRRRPPNSHRR
jgi:hypothetical protein